MINAISWTPDSHKTWWFSNFLLTLALFSALSACKQEATTDTSPLNSTSISNATAIDDNNPLSRISQYRDGWYYVVKWTHDNMRWCRWNDGPCDDRAIKLEGKAAGVYIKADFENKLMYVWSKDGTIDTFTDLVFVTKDPHF